MNFYSHKWYENGNVKCRLLKTHLIEVGENVYNSLNELKFNGNVELLLKSSIIISCLHDFGKYTSFFQNYLMSDKDSKSKSDGYSKYKSHAFISALYAAYCASKNNLPNEYIFYVYLSIKHHHGNLCNLDSDIGTSTQDFLRPKISEDIKIAKKQLEDLKHEPIKKDMEDIFTFGSNHGVLLNFIDDFFKEDLTNIFNMLVKINKNRCLNNTNMNIDFSEFLLLYSLLIDNDKRNAASIKNYDRKDISPDIIDKYKNQNLSGKTEINKIRNNFYESVKKNVQNIDLNDHFFTITSPTGTGKTISGLYTAFSIRNKLFKNTGNIFRIIYTLPFTTIVDQNYDTGRNILETCSGFKNNDERYIIKHHHLSILSGKIDDEELSTDEVLMLTEDWDSEIIFTTFVQLFSALAGYKNKNLKKYYRIINSIVILDEIQAIDIAKWPQIRYLMNYYAKKFNIYFILMSATLPELVNNSIELGGDYQKRFEELNRVNMHINILERLTPKEIVKKYMYHSETAKLFVFNTINTSIEAFNYLKENVSNDVNIYYLSSNIVPIKKKGVMDNINEDIKNNKKIIVVATQIFEAGVDISFDMVIRDIAPIDSLIQSSGRVNRNSFNTRGNMYIVNCVPEKNGYDGYYCRQVYGKIHTDTTIKILSDRKIVEEKDYLKLIRQYYSGINQNLMGSSENLQNALNKLDFNSRSRDDHYYVSNFSMIDDLDKYISIFVELDYNAMRIIDIYINRKSYEKADIIKLKREMYNYIISARIEDIKNIACEPLYKNSTDFFIIRNNYLKNSYSDETGLKKISDGAFMV